MASTISSTIIIIPARGGSKEIPRKNLKLLGGEPLLQHILSTVKNLNNCEVIVSTDDSEIEYLANNNQVKTIQRPPEFATDKATLDEVVIDAVKTVESNMNHRFEKVITIQPTSPFISTKSILSAINLLDGNDCVISVVDSRHLRWGEDENGPKPLYEIRTNRQWLPPTWSETGGIIGCSRESLETGSRINGNVALLKLMGHEAIDIDTHIDWALAETLLSTPTVAIRVIGDTEHGLGHVFRGLTIASRLNSKPLFITDDKSTLAKELIISKNYNCSEYSKSSDLVKILLENQIDVLLNDVLDTTQEEMNFLKEKTNCIISNFEDLGTGSSVADVTFNALYEHKNPLPNQRYGWEWFCARDEFCNLESPAHNNEQIKVLVTFGGTDPRNLTTEVINALSDEHNISNLLEITVILGPGNNNGDQIKQLIDNLKQSFASIELLTKVERISKYMQDADIAITSNGRTVFEIAVCETPMITISQNERETLHTFSQKCKGAIDLGYSIKFPKSSFLEAISNLTQDKLLRDQMKEELSKYNLTSGTERVISEINRLYKNGRIKNV